ncbi:hypothetical protein GMDG_07355 [Pseudogymnoascus destructans 20631-21]|uniref:Mitochondrial fission process protein 1 n=1 Tax=Pseudogymnoascus destructans (strain ATCC MYA-4855 / 20631-21) TaxID=658429 RepID=L8FWU6_PSED2|nr:hypothetical protein GMDG_07355 [Pseudogymnoascus destructans 20631-21]
MVDRADKDQHIYDEVRSGTAPESTESSIRYAAYATRIRTALLSAQRYVAYTSDVGESFRPVAHPNLVRAAYGISWAYLAGDVAHEGYKAYCANQRTLHPEGVAGGVEGGVGDAGGCYTAGRLPHSNRSTRPLPRDSLHGPPHANNPLHRPLRRARNEKRQISSTAHVGPRWARVECGTGVAVFV